MKLVETYESFVTAESPLKASKAYEEYLKSLPPEKRMYIYMTFTFPPKYNYVPRWMIPRLLNIEDFYNWYMSIIRRGSEYHESLPPPNEIEREAESEKLELSEIASYDVCIHMPSFEPATYYATSFFRHYLLLLDPIVKKRQPWRFLDLVRYYRINQCLSTAIFGVGHGNVDIFTGQYFRPIWCTKYPWTLDPVSYMNKFIKLLSCLCGRELGPYLVKNGAKCFLGYVKEYIFSTGGPEFMLVPWADPVARMFIGTYVDAVKLAVNKFAPARLVYEYEKSMYLNYAEQVEKTDPDLANLLRYEASIHVLLGNENARIA